MQANIQSPEIKRIVAYNLLDFAVELEKAIVDGYRVSLDNENYPVMYGTHFTAGLIMPESKPLEQPLEQLKTSTDSVATGNQGVGSQEGSESVETVKRGRKMKQ